MPPPRHSSHSSSGPAGPFCPQGPPPSGQLARRLAVEGYPDDHLKGQEVAFDPVDDEAVVIFNAGVVKKGGKLINQAGRVVSVCARAASLSEALAKAYQAVPKVRFEGARYRRDIGYRALESVQTARESGISFRPA